MEIKVIASTKLGNKITKQEADKLGGLAAGVCYLKNNITELFNEPEENTQNRIAKTKNSGHTSPYEHASMMLELTDVPKIIAMMLNNEKVYTTSEKSARYRQMKLPDDEQPYYDKWVEIFQKEIKEKYLEKYPEFFKGVKIQKLAQENARYLTSVFTPTSMVYSVSYRQLNILYSLFKKESKILENETDDFSKRLKVEVDKFIEKLEELPYWDEKLFDSKNRHLSLFDRRYDRPIIKQYGDVYLVAYKGSFAQLAQAQRHRTVDYKLRMPEEKTFYIPPIIKSNEILAKAWVEDCNALARNYPQGMLVDIIESGSVDNLIMKSKERKCTCAQLEIDNQTTDTMMEVYEKLKEQNHPAAQDLEPYAKKSSRCTFPDYTCKDPCNFKDGILGERFI